MSQFSGFTSSGLIDYLRETTEVALDLSKNLTAAHSPSDVFMVWAKFAEGQYAAAEKLTYQLTGGTIAGAKNFGLGHSGLGNYRAGKNQASGASPMPAKPAASAVTKAAEDAAAITELQDQADELRSQMEALSAQVAALADRQRAQGAELSDKLDSQIAALSDKLVALGREPLKLKFSFGEPPHTGWTPSKVVVLGHDGNGNLIELPSTIEEGGFRYIGAPSFWIAIG